MRGVDTNILVRFLTGDDLRQSKRVYALFKAAEAAKSELFVSTPVLLELIWVLESAYEVDREDLIDALSSLILMPIFVFQNERGVQQFVRAARDTSVDLSDLLIAYTCLDAGCEETLTFDKKAARHDLFALLRA